MDKKKIRTIFLYEYKLGRKAAETGSLVNRKRPILLHDNARPPVSNFLREKIFQDAVNTFVEFIHSRTPDFYCNGIGPLVERWRKCIESNGNYFDEINSF
ncbi:Histone-lysine N-methyltransferase SETMAR [Habropoda laboriosa]|uniref:Histone-lysine N-methyltransferase SETMAR n=1 Tax=Habropoda laboriosa TaxID=597456 RepID=A0A0L7REL6_9HYME|nr:Histone-lysine N-methyltransferase SETMAR [Habropoda laboriosa]